MPKENIQRLKIGGFPIISAIIEKLNLKAILSKYIKLHGNEKISTVDTLVMILLNIVTGRQPMYELKDWACGIHPSCFGFKELDTDVLNDDRFGRAVEKMYDADRATIMTEVVLSAIKNFDIDLEQFHNDSTSIKAFGRYHGKTKTGLELKRGHSKDHRPDLKQLIYTLTISSDGAVPVHYKCYPGNRTDDTTHVESWTALKNLVGRPDFIYVADCKVCTKEQLSHIVSNGGRVITIIPETWGEVKKFKEELRCHTKTKKEILRMEITGTHNEIDYFYSYSTKDYTDNDGYRIHWICSSEKKKRDLASREKKLKKTEGMLGDLMAKVNKRGLKTRLEIEEKYKEILNKIGTSEFYHVAIDKIKTHRIVQIGKGRPGPKTKYKKTVKTIYTISWTRDEQELKKEKKLDGIFPLLSTDTKIEAKEALVAYKYQPRIEKRFEHLKKVLLGAPLLFKRVERIEGFMFMHFLGLMVLSLIEREIRNAMKTEDIEELFIYPEDRASVAPTASIVLRRFEDLSVYYLRSDKKIIKRYKDDLTKKQKKILRLVGVDARKYWPDKL